MPVRAFWQPYDEALPDPSRWEFRFWPVGDDGYPAESLVLLPDWVSEDWLACDLMMIVVECEERLTVFDGSRFVYPSQFAIDECAVNNENRCREVEIQTPPDGWLGIRACGDTGISCSSWTTVAVPEVDVITGVLVGTLLLGGIINERSRKRRRARAVRGVRVNRQRRSLRGRIREVLRRGLRMVGVR